VTIRARRAPGGSESRPVLLLEVEDTGIGISTEALPGLFTPFFSGRPNRTAGASAAPGWAWSSASGWPRRWVASFPWTAYSDGVSTFRMTLQLEALTDPVEAGGTDCRRAACISGRRVLLVEDNVVNRMLAVAMLENLGIEVTQAENGQAAVHEMERRQFDLVLMDWPDAGDGRIRGDPRNPRARTHRARIAKTSHHPGHGQRQSGDAGSLPAGRMDAYLAKALYRSTSCAEVLTRHGSERDHGT